MSRQISPGIEATIQHYLASGRYDSETDLLREAFNALELRERERFLVLQTKIQKSFEDGTGVELTPKLMDELERESEARYVRGERVDPNAGP